MITCYNRDTEGRCLAYNEGTCSPDCQARIPTIEAKIDLIRCLLSRAQSKKDKRELERELELSKKIKEVQDQKRFEGWMGCYLEDVHRGSGGGSSESDANKATRMKALMKDNRPVDVKPTQSQLTEYKEALREWEEENGKLERLGRTGLSHSKEDSYTGYPVCYVDDGIGKCSGQVSAKGNLARDCKMCDLLSDRRKPKERGV